MKAGWRLSSVLPAHWSDAARDLGASFFHTPQSALTMLPAGQLVFAELVSNGETVGIALGVGSECRLSRAPRHFHFGTYPVFTPEIDRERALHGLVALLGKHGAAVISMDSFDSAYGTTSGVLGKAGRLRCEHVVALGDPEVVRQKFSSTHRRHVNRGLREGWSVRLVEGQVAEGLLNEVQQNAAERNGYQTSQLRRELGHLTRDADQRWGMRCYAAFRDDVALAAVLVGWCGQRGFYLIGGSTPEGYQVSAAVWLQWRVMADLCTMGVRFYNLGGTPVEAEAAPHPQHGLYRFKTGFGGTAVTCRGMRWELRPQHMRLHRLLSLVRKG